MWHRKSCFFFNLKEHSIRQSHTNNHILWSATNGWPTTLSIGCDIRESTPFNLGSNRGEQPHRFILHNRPSRSVRSNFRSERERERSRWIGYALDWERKISTVSLEREDTALTMINKQLARLIERDRGRWTRCWIGLSVDRRWSKRWGNVGIGAGVSVD